MYTGRYKSLNSVKYTLCYSKLNTNKIKNENNRRKNAAKNTVN
jgi:hypothetical protein